MRVAPPSLMISLQAAVTMGEGGNPGQSPHQLQPLGTDLCGRCRFIRWRSRRELRLQSQQISARFTFRVWVVSVNVSVSMNVYESEWVLCFPRINFGWSKKKKRDYKILFIFLAQSIPSSSYIYRHIEHTSWYTPTHTLTQCPQAICGRAWKTFTASKLKLMRSFSKSGLNAHTGRIWGIAQGQNFEPSQPGMTGRGLELSLATDTDTYVILKYLSSSTHTHSHTYSK